MRPLAGSLLIAAAACAEPTLGDQTAELATAVRHERYALIRDAAAEMGLYNAALMAGIATSETNLAHCQSEATFACQGPASPSCGGGPIIAGAADGPCSAMQGGLGMFQFDAGTYAETLATYGEGILTIEGNTAQAVSFVVDRAEQSVTGVDDWLSAVAWMNAVPMRAGEPGMEAWASFIVCRYNGCCTPTSATCQTRAAKYRDNAITAFDEMGAEFWRTSDRCAELPKDGVIDQRSACYLAGGDPRYWHREAGGFGGSREWTGTTAAAAPGNFARWIVHARRAGRYSVEIVLDGGDVGTATNARYVIVHAGVQDEIVIDQTSASGWVSLGDFEFAGDGGEYVALADNTGVAKQQLLFDAVRVVSLDDAGGGGGGGCCDATRSSGPTALLGFGIVGVVLRRRVRRTTPA